MNTFIEALIQKMPRSENFPDISHITVPKTNEEYLEWQCRIYNQTVGNMTGYDCQKCLNRGYISMIKNDVLVQRDCECLKIRKGILQIKEAGFERLAERCTFEKFTTHEEWQKRAKAKAMQYVSEKPDKWLFVGGQTGCGKTHLCTAVSMKFMNQGYSVQYVLWRDFVHSMEQNRFDESRYTSKIQKLKNVDVLYIDDFLKTANRNEYGKAVPSVTELNIAYEIINARDISNKRTIISSEMHIEDISAFEDSVSGRISQHSENWQILLNYDKTRNFRFHGKEVKNHG